MVIIAAFSLQAWQDRLSALLQRLGLMVRKCTSGNEVLRMALFEPSLILCGTRLTDMSAIQLAQKVGTTTKIIVIGKPASVLELLPNMQLLPVPVSSAQLLATIHTYLSAPPPLSLKDRNELINQAKSLLMTSRGMTEQQAHRYLQKTSMNNSRRLTAVAEMIVYDLNAEKEEK